MKRLGAAVDGKTAQETGDVIVKVNFGGIVGVAEIFEASVGNSAPELKQPVIECVEEVDREALQRLYDGVDTDERFTSKGERTKFKLYAKRLLETEHCSMVVKYFPAKGKQSGRYNVQWGQSIATLSKWIRVELARGLYHDVDMANCHPVLLIHKCEHEWSIACPKLRYYVENRQEVLERVDPSNPKRAKNILLQLMYGAQHFPLHKMDPFVRKYARELETIARHIAPEPNPKLSPADQRTQRFSHLSIVIQHEEHRLLMLLRERLEEHWGMSVGVLMFDGLLARRRKDNPDGRLDPAILEDCQQFILEKTGMTITLTDKPF